MSTKFEITAEPRAAKGTGASRRLRRAGKVPAVVYGAGKDPVPISLDHSAILRNLGFEAFHTSVLTLHLDGATDQAVLRDYHMHATKPVVLHVDLQRVSATEKIHMSVPLHFVGEDVAPGVKQEGGIVNHLMTEVDVTCLPHQLPEFLEVDMSQVHLNESVHMSDVKLPEGVAITHLAHGAEDLAVATMTGGDVEEAAPGAPEEAVAPAAGEAGAPGVPEGKKP